MNYLQAKEVLFRYKEKLLLDMKPEMKLKHAKQGHLDLKELDQILIDEIYNDLDHYYHYTDKSILELKDRLYKTALYYNNRPLITFMTNKFHRNHLDYDYKELWDQAQMGLSKALSKYDPHRLNPKTHKPYRFNTFAYIVVMNYLRQAVTKHEKAHVAPPINEIIRAKTDGQVVRVVPLKYKKKVKDHAHKLVHHFYTIVVSDNGSEQAISYLYHLRVHKGDKVKKGQILGETSNIGLKVDSMDRVLGQDKDGNEYSLTNDLNYNDLAPEMRIQRPEGVDVKLEKESVMDNIRRIIDSFDPLTKKVICYKFPILINHPEYKSLTQSEIGKCLSIPTSEVSKRQRVALTSLRKELTSLHLDFTDL